MSERFDVLFAGLAEEKAIELLKTNPEELKNPVEKYTAATRLAACQSDESLEALIEAISLEQENLFNRITRRKVLEALGRRRDSRALPGLFSALRFDDEPSVINAVDSIAQIGSALNNEQRRALLNALKGSDNQKRSVIQAHTRLGIEKADHEISVLEDDANPLVAGAARAYAAKIHGRIDRLKPLIPQLTDPIAGRRRSAVIDLGDAGESSVLEHLVSSPVSIRSERRAPFKSWIPRKQD